MTRLKKRSDGRYQKFIRYTDSDGNSKRKPVYGRTLRQLEEKVQKAIEEEKCKPGSCGGLTVGEWARTWLKTDKPDISYNTRKMYEIVINTYIVPAIGHLPLALVQLDDIQELLNASSDNGHKRTAQQIYITLRQIFERARKRNYIIKNPTLDAERPLYKKPDKRSLSDEEVQMVKQAPMLLKEKTFILLLLHTGLRRGEALALTRADLDMKNNCINVHKSLYFEINRPFIKPPKSKSGTRKVPIINELKPILAEYLLSQNGSVLFPSASGEFMSQTAFRRFWVKIIKSLNEAGATASDITLHIFRHTFCSCLVRTGVAIKDAQYILGHASARITLDWYTHFDPKATENVRNRLNQHVVKNVVNGL
ncbi:MAG: site-specific integrase [Clostridiales bacterium]|nr:site-specific integrase [Clostridiales bacterium]